jgi:hypothetical protein
MISRKASVIFAAAVFIALAIALFSKPPPYVEQLIRIQAEQEFGHIDKAITNEPLEVQGMLLDYAGNKRLLLKAWTALSKYPKEAREILPLYGSEPEFQEILLNYGDLVIPPIQYFRENEVWTVTVMDTIRKTIKEFAIEVNRLWDSESAKENPRTRVLGPNERGWYAVNFIKQEGHDFLGQFLVNKEGGKVKWLQTERFLEAITSFFSSGMRTIEVKTDLGENITTADAFWAGVDIAILSVPLKLFKGGKAVGRSGEELNITTRTRLFAPRLLSKGKIFQKMGKYGAVVATLYIVATHPSLINSLLREMAELLGLSPWLVQVVGWFLIIAFILYPFLWLLKAIARFILFGFSWLEQSWGKTQDSIGSRTRLRQAR